jgi:hypothetical protein
MKIDQFDTTTCKLMRREIEEALDKVGQRYGVAFQGGNIRYTSETFAMKITGATRGKNGEVIAPEVKDFNRYCGMYGMVPSDLGKTFVSVGYTYKLVGLKPKNHKYPFIGQREDGKRFKFDVGTVRRALGQ